MRVVLADPIHQAGIERLERAGHHIIDATDRDDERPTAISSAEALVVRSATTVDADMIESARDLRIIARAGIGVDTIDIEAASTAGVLVVNAPTGGVSAVAEHTMAMCHALIRELPWIDRQTRNGAWPKAAYTGGELAEQTLGIVGLGRIGREVANRASRLGMDLVGADPKVSGDELGGLTIALDELHGCAARADILTVHTPLVPETRGLIDDAVFDELEGGYLVNCSRGGVVNEGALVDALRSGQVAGAALDVFEDEPIGADHPLTSLDNTLLTPHVAGTSARAQRTIALEIADQLIEFFRGEQVNHPVNEPGE